MAKKRANGEGTFYRRKDGRYEGAMYVPVAPGRVKRVRAYGKTRAEAHVKLQKAIERTQRRMGVPDELRPFRRYLDHWLGIMVTSRRPTTYEQYRWVVEHYLKPDLGLYELTDLSVALVQRWIARKYDEGCSPHRLRLLRTVLSAVLTRAQREELLQRNVARFIELPAYAPQEREPWTATEARRYLQVTCDHLYHPAFVLLITYGLRRGELLGLCWEDVDEGLGVIHVRNQLQRYGGAFHLGPVKTLAGKRDLPLIPLTQQALTERRQFSTSLTGLVFTTIEGTPLDPDSFGTTFQRLAKRHGLRPIRLHDLRHTAATLLKDLGVPARDVQVILGHADIVTTQQIYQHADMENRRQALEQVGALLGGDNG